MQEPDDATKLFSDVPSCPEVDPAVVVLLSLTNIASTGRINDQRSVSSLSTRAGKNRRKYVKFYLETRYNVVRSVCANQMFWKKSFSVDACDIFWTDVCMGADRFCKLKPHQRYNHFIGMNSITRKNNLGRNLLRMRKFFKSEYSFFPETWILPMDLPDFKSQPKKKTYIVKPDNSCQGKGIYITQNPEAVKVDFEQGWVAQLYLARPLLLDGFKFDLRVYVLVTGCDPLRVYVHTDGLVRLCCTPWESSVSNLSEQTMHLTNYAVNVKSGQFIENSNPNDIHDGHKRSLKCFFDHIPICKARELVTQIDDLVIKTLICVQPSLAHVNFSCQPDDLKNEKSFEILGFDIILDQDYKPWLLEVNHAPSFATDSQLDTLVKYSVINDTMKLLNVCPPTKHAAAVKHSNYTTASPELLVKIAQERDSIEKNFGGFRKIYPTEMTEKNYARFHDKAIEVWETLTGAASRKPVRLWAAAPPLPAAAPKHKVRPKPVKFIPPIISVPKKRAIKSVVIPVTSLVFSFGNISCQRSRSLT